ncbi:hypothetical protein E2C01_073628 [Portunus trituberculatus]|uniref:Uncharacterized protein n=1 Tax=Portunus trituberculatus TaxID=210409 RepID=A0A5B7IA85_PORTR|nr:hypothetical protein [Portunus trituberculatus]
MLNALRPKMTRLMLRIDGGSIKLNTDGMNICKLEINMSRR